MIAATRRVKRGWMNLRVVEVVDETHDAKTFYMVDAEEGGRPYDFIAGQYLTFRFDDIAAKPLVRSYTMSGSPRQTEHTIFTVKRIDGGLISNWLCDHVNVGTVLRARGPIGKFCYDPAMDTPHLFMTAGGSGVTPFVSIIREYADKLGMPGSPESLHLLVAYRSRQDLLCWKDLEGAKQYANVQIVTTLTRDEAADDEFWTGRPNSEMLDRFFAGRHAEATVMTCGPQAIMDLTTEHLRRYGVDEARIKTESFES